MTSDRSYRNARSVEVAVAELRKNAGTPVRPGHGRRLRQGARHASLGAAPHASSSPPAEATETPTKDHDDPTRPIEVVSGP